MEHFLARRSARIFVVDDDPSFRESLVRNISDAGYEIRPFPEGTSALAEVIEFGPPDLILLDWKMPGLTGIEVLRELRRRDIPVPVVFLTVLGHQLYEEAGLNGGAVDFVEKSRGFPILLRRIELILAGQKAKQSHGAEGRESYGHIELRRDISRVLWKNARIELTLTEFKIVEYMVLRAGQDVRYRELYDIVHGEGFAAGSGEMGYRVNVRSLVKRIRQKFRQVDTEFSNIENYPGFGYRWSKG